jgi:hypothetical protein
MSPFFPPFSLVVTIPAMLLKKDNIVIIIKTGNVPQRVKVERQAQALLMWRPPRRCPSMQQFENTTNWTSAAATFPNN